MVVPISSPTTLSFESFDVSSRTGFMPSYPPLGRLPAPWEAWEVLLDDARLNQLQPGDKWDISSADKTRSEQWRLRVNKTPLLSTDGLSTSVVLLRRAHLVLTFLMHFYIHTLPPDAPVVIPCPISIPILQVAKVLDLPPVITLSDTVLYNWTCSNTSRTISSTAKLRQDIRCQTLFTNLPDEAAFYLCSALIELRGADALAVMRASMDELNTPPVTGDIDVDDHDLNAVVARLTAYLSDLSVIIDDLKSILVDVRMGCDPEIYYTKVRPWFRGEDSGTYSTSESGHKQKRRWIFEGAGEYADLNMLPPDRELSGASAGQSSLIHSLDVFFGVDHDGRSDSPKFNYMKRMQRYMPRQHRTFLDHLGKTMNRYSLREFVLSTSSVAEGSEGSIRRRLQLKEAYNKAVKSLKEFRDQHLVIATLYIIGPARRAAEAAAAAQISAGTTGTGSTTSTVVPMNSIASTSSKGIDSKENALKGTGGTDLVQFLKDVRSETFRALLTDETRPRRVT